MVLGLALHEGCLCARGRARGSLLAAALLAALLPLPLHADLRADLENAAARAEAGGAWHVATREMMRVLREAPANSHEARDAIMLLGRWGDGSAVAPLLEAARAGDEDTRAAVAHALARLQGRHATRAMATQFASAPPSLQPAMLHVIAAREADIALPLLLGSLEQPALREDALVLLATRDDPAVVQHFLAALDTGDGDVAPALRDAARRLQETLLGSSSDASIGRGHLLALRLAATDVEQRTALEGLARYPSAEAAALLPALLSDEALKDAAIRASVPAANAALRAGDIATAESLLAAAAKAAGRAQPEGLGFLRMGLVAGPFRPAEGEDGWEVDWASDAGTEWKPFSTTAPAGMVDLIGLLGAESNCFGVALIEFEADAAGGAVLRLGSDDGVAAWLNGEKVHENRVDRGVSVDSDLVPVRLRAGANRLQLVVQQGGGGWGFCARLTDGEGWPIDTRSATP